MNKEEALNKLMTYFPNTKVEIVEFSGYKKPCKIKCLKCGKIYTYTRFSSLAQVKRKYFCNDCYRREQNFKRFTQSLSDLFPNEKYKILQFTNASSLLKIQCGQCGHVDTFQYANSIKNRKHICRKCHPFRYEELEKTKEYFINFLKDSPQWTLMQDLDNIHSQELITCRCNKCKKENQKSMYDYLKGIGCECGRAESWKQQLNKTAEEEQYNILETSNWEGRVKLQHCCNFIYSVRLRSFLEGGGRCPQCTKTQSKGERKIAQWLKDNNIIFEIEVPIIIENHPLRFDFYLPEYDYYIEFQGRQHYESVNYFGGEKTFQRQRYYDNLKRQYCKNKNNLLEISYNQMNEIENILSLQVQRLSLIGSTSQAFGDGSGKSINK